MAYLRPTGTNTAIMNKKKYIKIDNFTKIYIFFELFMMIGFLYMRAIYAGVCTRVHADICVGWLRNGVMHIKKVAESSTERTHTYIYINMASA